MSRTSATDADRSRVRAVLDRLSAALAARVGVDRRALAAFRIGLGAVLLADLAARSRSLTAFYTDAGVLPRRALFADYGETLSLHAISGESWAIALLFAVAGAVALALLVGYRTRLATAVSWLLLLSLHARNPMVLNAGDDLFLALLFWSVFLPLGSRWSVDAVRRAGARDNSHPADNGGLGDGDAAGDGGAASVDSGLAASGPTATVVANVATMAVLVQILVMYLTNAVHKFESELWMSGEAVAYVMQADQFSYLLGNYIAGFSGLLRVFTVLWIALLFASPLLLLLTGWPRAALASLFVGMHLGMAVTIQVGMFPIIVVIGFLPFFQTPVWNALERAVDRLGWAAWVARWRHRFESMAQSVAAAEASLPGSGAARRLRDANVLRGLARGRVLVTTVVPYVFLVLILLSSAASVGYAEVPEPAGEALDTTEMEQSWQMFAPDPIHTTRWFVAAGTLEDGAERDVFRNTAVTFARPARADATYPSARWRKYLQNVYGVDNENHRSYFANHLCGKWNRTHEAGVERVRLYTVYERTNPYNGTVQAANKFELIEYDCSGAFIQNE